MISSDDPKITLLIECYELLEDGGNESNTIRRLLARIRPFIFSSIPYDEVATVRFRCPGCHYVNLEVLRSDGMIWDDITCDCDKRYRVVWQEGESKTYILEVTTREKQP